ncbi:methylmalonyl-CoA epimerase, mitochondrial [Hyalella azteca]|uniref:Methylmalonyl-CoA epimerase, mitochondrial n=1 Tax=Hyalella azteca TaxID=294128 RepID=A0A8B7P5B5_HYAAZ|nr:methylmalonyl-CoA epimerase, mitochondrial [Hyalella azteca]
MFSAGADVFIRCLKCVSVSKQIRSLMQWSFQASVHKQPVSDIFSTYGSHATGRAASSLCPPSMLCHQPARSLSDSPVWKLGRLNHIAIAVPDLQAAASFYQDVLGARVSDPQALPEHGVTTVFVELSNTKLELLHPLGDASPIAKFLQRNAAGGLHHVCLEVSDIEAAVETVRASGVRCLAKTTSIGAHGKPVMFLHPADCHGVLVELEQE